jgi:glutamine amidotransferase
VSDWRGTLCRHQAWLGEPRTLAQLVLEPPLGLLRQSWEPRRQTVGKLNGDGWGVGFYVAGHLEPVRWRGARPLWQETSFASVAPVLSSGAVLAAVRSATVGMPIEEAAAAPFTDGRWLLSHNGHVDRGMLPATHAAESTCDAAVLAAHVFERGPEKVARTVLDVADSDPDARLNLLLTDGQRILATTWGHTLSYRVEAEGVIVASEPCDDEPGWVDVPDRSLLEATRDSVAVTSLES